MMAGERGKQGDHGQTGDVGAKGKTGKTGAKGERGRTVIPTRIVNSFIAVTIVFFLSLGALAYAISENRERLKENQKANMALCALRHDLEVRIAATNKLLKEDPGDIFGIPRALIVSGRDNQKQTIDNLNILDCEQEE